MGGVGWGGGDGGKSGLVLSSISLSRQKSVFVSLIPFFSLHCPAYVSGKRPLLCPH